jgi:plasmid stabilization system protein ParE
MAGDNVRKMVYQFLGKEDEHPDFHIQTVKITEQAHAKLRGLADITKRSKTPLAADLLMAAIDDAIEALPNDPLDEATADKLRGVVRKEGFSSFGDYEFHPRGLRDIALERADLYLAAHDYEQLEKQNAAAVSPDTAGKNGAHK